jgi:hypothetical protein
MLPRRLDIIELRQYCGPADGIWVLFGEISKWVLAISIQH